MKKLIIFVCSIIMIINIIYFFIPPYHKFEKCQVYSDDMEIFNEISPLPTSSDDLKKIFGEEYAKIIAIKCTKSFFIYKDLIEEKEKKTENRDLYKTYMKYCYTGIEKRNTFYSSLFKKSKIINLELPFIVTDSPAKSYCVIGAVNKKGYLLLYTEDLNKFIKETNLKISSKKEAIKFVNFYINKVLYNEFYIEKIKGFYYEVIPYHLSVLHLLGMLNSFFHITMDRFIEILLNMANFLFKTNDYLIIKYIYQYEGLGCAIMKWHFAIYCDNKNQVEKIEIKNKCIGCL